MITTAVQATAAAAASDPTCTAADFYFEPDKPVYNVPQDLSNPNGVEPGAYILLALFAGGSPSAANNPSVEISIVNFAATATGPGFGGLSDAGGSATNTAEVASFGTPVPGTGFIPSQDLLVPVDVPADTFYDFDLSATVDCPDGTGPVSLTSSFRVRVV